MDCTIKTMRRAICLWALSSAYLARLLSGFLDVAVGAVYA